MMRATVLSVLAFVLTVPSAQAAPSPATLPAAVASPDSAPPRLSHAAEPIAEAVDLTLDPDKADYHGSATIGIHVAEPTRELRFHARALTIDRATVVLGSQLVPIERTEHLAPDQTRLVLGSELPAGASATLSIEFHNAYNTRAVALYRVVTGGHSYLFTQFEDTEAREAFPCWDEPEFKIPWTVTLTVPDSDLAISNTPIAHETKRGAMRRVEFAPTKPLPSYLVAVAVGPFDTVPVRGMSMPGRIVTIRGATPMAAEAARVTPAIIRSLEGYFGRPYPYEKLDLIAAPEFLYGARENAGAVVFADRRLLLDPASVDPGQRRALCSVIAHELAHQWFGDLVTMKWWDDLWLNESFASWMATKVMDEVEPESRSGITTLYAVERAIATDSRPSTGAMRQKVTGATSLGQTATELTYDKGEAVLTMFEGWLGRDTFRRGVLEYLKAHEWRNAEGGDLWRALGQVSGERIDAAMSTFLDQPGVPLVTIEPLAGGKARVSQHRFFTVDPGRADTTNWRIPVILRYPAGSEVRTLRVWLTRADTVADLGATPAWIEPNAGASGYYRWSVPDPMLDALVGARRRLTARERIDLIANLQSGLRAGLVRGDRFLALMAQLSDEPSPEVTRAAIDALNDTRVPLATPASEAAYAGWVRGVLQPELHRFGMEPAARESLGVSLMRPALLRLLAAEGDTAVIRYAERLGAAYRRDHASVPPSLVEVGIVVGAYRGDRAQFEDYRRRFESTTIPNERILYLAGLASFRDPALRQDALAYALSGPLRPQEGLVIPANMSLNGLTVEGGRSGSTLYSDDIADWMMDHYSALAARMPPNFSARVFALGAGCSGDRLERMKAWIADPAHKVVGGEYSFRRLRDAMLECSTLHERESARVERWLESYATARP